MDSVQAFGAYGEGSTPSGGTAYEIFNFQIPISKFNIVRNSNRIFFISG